MNGSIASISIYLGMIVLLVCFISSGNEVFLFTMLPPFIGGLAMKFVPKNLYPQFFKILILTQGLLLWLLLVSGVRHVNFKSLPESSRRFPVIINPEITTTENEHIENSGSLEFLDVKAL